MQEITNVFWFKEKLSTEMLAWWDSIDIKKLECEATYKVLVPDSVTSREDANTTGVPSLTIDGLYIKENIPDLYLLYKGYIRDKAEAYLNEKVFTAENDIYGVNMNIQKGRDMRYECHVDSNPLQGVLYLTEHRDGGELVISNNAEAIGVDAIEQNCVSISPEFASLYLFDLRNKPHYVRPLLNDGDVRVAVTMNFYTLASPESLRPTDLTKHLF